MSRIEEVRSFERSVTMQWRSRQTWISVRLALGLVGLAPWLVPLLEQHPCCRGLGESVRRLYGLQCHQRLDRSVQVLGAFLPVCARCLGVYFGLLLAAVLTRPRLRLDAYKAWILVGVTLMALDVATEWVGLRPASASVRCASGALLAYAIGLCISEALRPRRGIAIERHRGR